MSNVAYWTTDKGEDTKILEAGARPGIDVQDVTKAFTGIVPYGGSTRSLQAAAEPERYNLAEYPTNRAHSEEIIYEREEVTLSEAESDYHLSGRISHDDRFDFEDDEVVFIRHTWVIPKSLTQEPQPE